MGPETTGHMLLGAIVGWGILSPLAKGQDWAPGPVSDWAGGSRGWLVWVSLAIMLSDSIISLAGILLEPLIRAATVLNGRKLHGRRGSYSPLFSTEDEYDESEGSTGQYLGLRKRRNRNTKEIEDDTPEQDARPEDQVPMSVVLWGLLASAILCIVAVRVVFDQVPLYATIVAFLLALVLSVMGVRALGMSPQI